MRCLTITLALLCVPLLPTAEAVTIRVPGDLPTIQDGVDAAAVGDTVLVASGTYAGEGNYDIDFRGKDIVLRSESGPGGTVLDPQGTAHRLFVLSGGESPLAVIEGFSMTGGGGLEGHAIQLSHSSPTFKDCAVTSNADRGGVRAMTLSDGSSPVVIRTVFRNNRAHHPDYPWEGGAVYVFPGSSCLFQSCIFELNTVNWESDPYSRQGEGGAIDCDGAVTIEDCEFYDNGSGVRGGAVNVGEAGECVIRRSRFGGNWSGGGGAVNNWGVMTAEDCIFEENEGHAGPPQGFDPGWPGTGAAVYSRAGLVLSGCVFRENQGQLGGALRCEGGASITGCIFHGNVADYHARLFGGGAVWVAEGDDAPMFSHCTFYWNSSQLGSAVKVEGVPAALFTNCVMAFNLRGAATRGPLDLTCCDIFGNPGGDWVGEIADQYGIDGNISEDPRFCRPGIGDFSICENSPCAPAEQPECGLIGAVGVGCGPTSTVPTTWGVVKGLFRGPAE